jgi:predicted O-methyltransferase YrrM
VKTHPETFCRLEDLGDIIHPYRPTFDFPGPFIDASHRQIAECPLQDGTLIQMKNRRWFGKTIPGWLRREDALKLYELAYFTAGDILEIGSNHGLSTSILARASANSPRPKHVYAVDLNPVCTKAANRNLRSLGLHRYVTAFCDDAATAAKRYAAEGKRFGFVFIDHSHAYEPVYRVCRELANITAAGGFCLFHDFNDTRNRDPNDTEYEVYQAVMKGLDSDRFEFYGMYGCTALYRAAADK